ncbi:cytochrome-c peroxidase [Sphingobacterium sp. UT-1RO-CII-1]|uniref:cytochrome-c peroxidase n=1 Tax=Sphingobacterium sp. UT-1RO-CII-1 TaxID=2995225 RepID=UPI00227B1671|nr:cytochrome c peroxidase [Sphingobacterium sp. UT-1RO-CII-1]MCY4779771.1 cytochrome-c peroxidase [Sphingobacterium sp. UT-1RO-CII-1]
MNRLFVKLFLVLFLFSCNKEDQVEIVPDDNHELALNIPDGFPEFNPFVIENMPTKYGVELGEKLFHEKKFSGNNTISCASCHNKAHAFADNNEQAIGIYSRVGLRNTPSIQNLAFMKAYNWDGNIRQLERQTLVPIITHEEMNSSIVEVINKLKEESIYRELFRKAFGDENITADRIYRSISQYQYMLVSADSKYDKVKRGEELLFTDSEERGYRIFQLKCGSCHSTELFTDQSFRNIGFPINPSTEEAGRARVTGDPNDMMSFRVPSLRNAFYTAPYGSFGQFLTLRAVLDYLDEGVLDATNLDPILKENGNRIPMTEQEKVDIISFIGTLSDEEFVGDVF